MPKKVEAEAEAVLENCRALINRIEAGLSAEELIVNVSSAGELLFYLEFAASVLEKSDHACESVRRRRQKIALAGQSCRSAEWRR